MATFEIHTLDLNFQNSPEAIAAFLVMGPQGAVLLETGPGSTLPTLVRELDRFGVRPEDIRDVLLTHIHLDHAGAAGWWAQQGARIHVHHVGVPHLVDPSKLIASAQRIYGDRMDSLWGEFLPTPPEQIRALYDGNEIAAGGLRFLAIDTPGHARHHMAYKLEQMAFVGDLGGIRLSGRNHVRVPTPPPEFELEEWLASIRRLREGSYGFTRLYLTHFGAVEDVEAHWMAVSDVLKAATRWVEQQLAQGVDRDTMVALFSSLEDTRMAADGLGDEARRFYSSVGPVGMGVDGLIRYWKKRQR